MNKRFIFLLLALFTAMTLSSQVKQISAINNNWKFHQGDLKFDKNHSTLDTSLLEDLEWETINIPHTWNNLDAIDETPGYYRGIGWYKKVIDLYILFFYSCATMRYPLLKYFFDALPHPRIKNPNLPPDP